MESNSVSSRRLFIPYVIFNVLFHLAFTLFRKTVDDVESSKLMRAQFQIGMELIMLPISYLLFTRVSKIFDNVSLPSTDVLPLNTRWRRTCLPEMWRAVVILFLLLAHVSYSFYYFWITDEPNVFTMISLWSLGLFAHLAFLTIIFEILYAIVKFFENRLPEDTPKLTRLTRITREQVSVAIVVISFTLACGGLLVAVSDPVVRTEQIYSKHLTSTSGLPVKIALLTDLHIGPSIGRTRVEKIVEMTNALNPDVVAIAGDLADGLVANLGNAAAPLCNLKAKYGVYFSTGNHEYMHGKVDEWFTFLRNCNITVLHNQNRRLALPSNQTLCMAGMDDLVTMRMKVPGHRMDPRRALDGCKKGDLQVLLAHQPNAAKLVIKEGLATDVDLILSGHTHNGQMYIFLPVVWMANSYKRGLYYDAPTDTQIYVSAGVNFFGPPIKMFGNCEIINLEIFPNQSR